MNDLERLNSALFELADFHRDLRDADRRCDDRRALDGIAHEILGCLDEAYSALAVYINRPPQEPST